MKKSPMRLLEPIADFPPVRYKVEPFCIGERIYPQSCQVGPFRVCFSAPQTLLILHAEALFQLDAPHSYTTSPEVVLRGVEELLPLYPWNTVRKGKQQPGNPELFAQIDSIFQTFFGFPYCWFERQFATAMTQALGARKQLENIP